MESAFSLHACNEHVIYIYACNVCNDYVIYM